MLFMDHFFTTLLNEKKIRYFHNDFLIMEFMILFVEEKDICYHEDTLFEIIKMLQ